MARKKATCCSWMVSISLAANDARACFHRVNEPSSGELTQLAHTLAHRVGHYLERQGWLGRE